MEPEKKFVSLNSTKNIVKEVFERKKILTEGISTLLTHFRHPPKVVSNEVKISFPKSMLLPPAIDIGTSSIKLVQMAMRKDSNLDIARIDQEGYDAVPRYDSVVNLKKTLQRIIERNKVRGDCLLTIFTKEVLFFNVVFPPMSEFELTAAVKFKVSQLKPFGVGADDVFFRFIRLDDGGMVLGRQSQCKIIIICVLRETIKKWISLFDSVGLRPISIEVPALSLINLNKFSKKAGLETVKNNEVILWLDIGEEESFIGIEKGTKLNFARSLSLTSKKMTETVAVHCGVEVGQAKELMSKYGLIFWAPDKKITPFFEAGEEVEETNDKSKKVYYGLISLLENLVVDIEHSFKYFSYQVTQSQITKFDRVVLCGGGANLKNLVQFLTARLGVSVEPYNPFKIFSLMNIGESLRNRFINMGVNFTVCTALAAGQGIDTSQRISLLVQKRSEFAQFCFQSLKKKTVLAGILVGLIGVGFLGVQIGKAAFYKSKMSFYTRQVKEIKARLGVLQRMELELSKEKAEIMGTKNLLDSRVRLLKDGVRRPDEFSAVLGEIARLLPEEIWITELKYEDNEVTLTGSTTNTSLISQLIASIKESSFFISADFSYTQKEPAAEIYKFEIVSVVAGESTDKEFDEGEGLQNLYKNNKLQAPNNK
ncbi:MAG: pilus assembly protein PilM [Candidatus Omnitrophota bacterium]|nr:pilus assembly protein PilM [Candidatus Omnitrophota bacterium]